MARRKKNRGRRFQNKGTPSYSLDGSPFTEIAVLELSHSSVRAPMPGSTDFSNLRGLVANIVGSTNVPIDSQVQQCHFISSPFGAPITKCSIVINSDLLRKKYVMDKLVHKSNPMLSHLPERIVDLAMVEE